MKSGFFVKIFISSLFIGNLFADTMFDDGLYIGADYGYVSNAQSSTGVYGGTYSNNYSDIKLKAGYSISGYKVQLTYSMIEYTLSPFTFLEDNATSLVEYGVDFIKDFKMTELMSQFIKLGVGYGVMDLQGSVESTSITQKSVNIGIGVLYNVYDIVELIGGVDYSVRKWQDILGFEEESVVDTLSTSDSGIKVYVGINYKINTRGLTIY